MPSPSSGEETRALGDLLASTLALLGQFIAALNANNATTSAAADTTQQPPDPLRVCSDSAKLVKAHTTKLSLLAINKPFTPSAIIKVLRELSATCLPAMMSAVQICEQQNASQGGIMVKEAQARVRRVFKEMEMLLNEVQSISEGKAAATRRDSLSSTGVVWESCDAVIELERLGLAGLALQKVQQYRDTIKDAIEELRDWAEGDDLDTEGRVDGLLDSDDEGVAGDQDNIDDIFNAANSMPADRPELKELATTVEGKLKKIVLLYSALEKRRLATFKTGSGETAVTRLDEVMVHLRKIPHQVDELAIFLYDLDEQGANDMLEKCVNEARLAARSMESNWEGADDVATTWLQKWYTAVS
ncbi:hypothetical protein BDY17DRAFT_22918 [Neohortaea acidophila]|uniref:Cyclin-D1-binding protein 1-like N-terminal domain-containing protein n=1 Tax=Neohortaea acidophila TaxID=245834 RepID=A0A6A6Q6U9_9PEZI|nr:uncharacterized protein BDY17DRAFT_22918 [Neohortaea acidophila]KAF2488035.1 hypothetical protein BDY17DRAFT_22918 [Neohortaea acidophila]